jgi:hypothetical protein
MEIPPLYVISDGCSNLKRGIQDSGLVRICDVGHEIAKWVEQTYKHQEVFKTFSTSVIHLINPTIFTQKISKLK